MNLQFLWGLVAIICGAFMMTYGASLFRLVLVFAGFYIGFSVGMIIPMPTDSQFLHFLLAVVLGAIAGSSLYWLTKITLYAAGALLGLVVGLLVSAIFGQQGGYLGYGIGLAGAVLGGVFGKSLGDWAMILASAGAGAYATVIGVNLLLTPSVDPSNGLMPATLPALVIFIVFAAVSALAQMQILDLRRRIRNRTR